MKNKYLLFTCVLSLLAPLAFAQNVQSQPANADRGYIVNIGDVAPANFELKLANGTKTSLKELAGKIVILQFTASWCSVCREEMPHLEKEVWQAYKDRGVVLMVLTVTSRLRKLLSFRKTCKLAIHWHLTPVQKFLVASLIRKAA